MNKQTKQNLKLIFASAFALTALVLLIVILVQKDYGTAEVKNSINITYENLTDKEISFFEGVFFQVNALYLYEQGEIIVTKNITACEECTGYNIGKGRKIYIKFYQNEEFLKETISHEFAHTFLRSEKGDEDKNHPLHQIVYDLGRKKVAFDE